MSQVNVRVVVDPWTPLQLRLAAPVRLGERLDVTEQAKLLMSKAHRPVASTAAQAEAVLRPLP